jgi:hypothetical protein
MNLMETRDTGAGLETNLALGLSHLQLRSAEKLCVSHPGTIRTSRSKCKGKKPAQEQRKSEELGVAKADPPTPPSLKRRWLRRNQLSPSQSSNSQSKKDSRRSVKTSSSGSLPQCALPIDITSDVPPSEARSKWPWTRRSRTTLRSSKEEVRKSAAVEQSLEDFSGSSLCDDISELSNSDREYQWPTRPLVVEADVRDPVAPLEDEDTAPSTWLIHVLDAGSEVVESSGESKALWFRIYFHREDEYVYYRGTEILDYVRDLVELDGSFIFSVIGMSSGVLATIGATEVLSFLRGLIERATASNEVMPELVLSCTESTADDPINASSPVE